MTEIVKGEYVVAKAGGDGPFARGYGWVSYKAGDELLVTSKGGTFINVRKPRNPHVFRIGYDDVRPVLRPLGRVPEGGIEPDDPRIAWIFEDAARLADRLGLCRDFDRVTEALGLPGRERTFTITFEPSDGVRVTAKVLARSRVQAEQKLRGSVQQPVFKSTRQVEA